MPTTFAACAAPRARLEFFVLKNSPPLITSAAGSSSSESCGKTHLRILGLLDQQQQQKFQAIRDEHRRELLEKMGSQVMEKAEAKVKSEM